MDEGIVKSLKFSEENTTFNPQPTASSTPYSLSENYSHYMENLVGKLEIEPVPRGFSTTGQGVTTEGPLSGGSYTSSLATEELIQRIHLDFPPKTMHSLAVQTSFVVNPVTGEVSNGSELGKTQTISNTPQVQTLLNAYPEKRSNTQFPAPLIEGAVGKEWHSITEPHTRINPSIYSENQGLLTRFKKFRKH